MTDPPPELRRDPRPGGVHPRREPPVRRADDRRRPLPGRRASRRGGLGPTARVAPVAQAWRELSIEMDRAGAATAGELEPGMLLKLAPRLWVTLPG